MVDVQSLPTAAGPDLPLIDSWWRAANYLSVGQIYLLDNPLLSEPLRPEHIKPRLLGHWGTTPGLNLLYAHLNRVIRERTQPVLFVTGPGHGGPGLVANTWLEGTYPEVYPAVGHDLAGMRRLFRQFSFPGGIPSHVSPETPGSIHEGGELGYSLLHAYGAALDHPGLVVACVVGDGEAETGPAATSWHANKFLNPARDGAVLPILHLNGYKIANPTVLARIPESELVSLMRGYGYEPHVLATSDPVGVHGELAGLLDRVFDDIAAIQTAWRSGAPPRSRPAWPMIVLRTPKGWTGPHEVDGLQVEGTWRAHQVPLAETRTNPAHLALLEQWMRSYRPEELFDPTGRPVAGVTALAPAGELRMGANPVANGGLLRKPLDMPDFRQFASPVEARGRVLTEPTRMLGRLVAGVAAANPDRFRVFGPDETESNRLGAIYEVTGKAWMAEIIPGDNHLSPDGRVMEILSEHACQGWLEGYLLTGRHGLFSCYEAFVHIVDSMFNQHAKWLKVATTLDWRRPISSLNYLLTSHVWRQDHNGFSHQDPGFVDHVVNKSARIIRVYFPPDTNTLLAVADQCLRSTDLVNVIVAGKQPCHDWLTVDEAVRHVERGLGIWEWAGTEHGRPGAEPPAGGAPAGAAGGAPGGAGPDLVLACAGDVPTLETLAAAEILRRRLPDLRVRVVNVVDLMRLEPDTEHPHGLPDAEFDAIFTADRPVIFAYHGYPWLIHRLAYRRTNHHNLHVRGYKENGTTTTPFDMVMLNDMDRYHLVMDAIDRTPGLAQADAGLRQEMVDARAEAREWTRTYGEDIPVVSEWRWGA